MDEGGLTPLPLNLRPGLKGGEREEVTEDSYLFSPCASLVPDDMGSCPLPHPAAPTAAVPLPSYLAQKGTHTTNLSTPSQSTRRETEASPHTSSHESRDESPVLQTLTQCSIHLSSRAIFPKERWQSRQGSSRGALVVAMHLEIPWAATSLPLTAVSQSSHFTGVLLRAMGTGLLRASVSSTDAQSIRNTVGAQSALSPAMLPSKNPCG